MNRRMEGSEVGMWERREETLEPGLAWPCMALQPVPPPPPPHAVFPEPGASCSCPGLGGTAGSSISSLSSQHTDLAASGLRLPQEASAGTRAEIP